ncbi:pseudouridine synthase [sulfur-oxidizing endosymbiont of Gigantopelta aegis]|uniref:pseudouridine synthase n=1 Tax=sulfur-oxidizing endosymbiont of Gigantopelta aegis TaxID=2794934 RepID=UPI0018DBA87A|nr:pseudouridine synthase [sulfur-oxidizing endosymbiont of Gigantopelta aegis]
MTSNTSTNTSERFEKHLQIAHDNVTAIDILAEHTGFSRQKVKQIMQKGAVWLTQGKSTRRIRRASKKLQKDHTLHLYYDAKILAQTEFNAHLIADEGDYSVWYKPSGMLSQGSKYGDHGAIYRWAETHISPQRNAFLVHRLDRATSGLMMCQHFSGQFSKYFFGCFK